MPFDYEIPFPGYIETSSIWKDFLKDFITCIDKFDCTYKWPRQKHRELKYGNYFIYIEMIIIRERKFCGNPPGSLGGIYTSILVHYYSYIYSETCLNWSLVVLVRKVRLM